MPKAECLVHELSIIGPDNESNRPDIGKEVSRVFVIEVEIGTQTYEAQKRRIKDQRQMMPKRDLSTNTFTI